MDEITLHDAFVRRCTTAPQPAVTLGAGAIWMHAYNAVTTKGGRYVQGGGCGTSASPGLCRAAASAASRSVTGRPAPSLLEAEIVTADGEVRIANAAPIPICSGR